MISRRDVIKRLAQALAGAPLMEALSSLTHPEPVLGKSLFTSTARKNSATPIRHSVSRWPFNQIPLEDFCQQVKTFGIESVELVGPDEWPILKKYGLHCAMPNGADRLGLTRGFNEPSLHEQLIEDYSRVIPLVADAGYDKLICFSGNRNGLDDEEGLQNCSEGLKELMPMAEKHGVTLVMELLNSKVDHTDYQCDHTAWGARLVDLVGSDRFRLLYDIYHMQIMEGDVIRTIQQYKDYIVHFHTAGVPGRHEIDESQELYYPAIIQAIQETGYEGFVGQEFIPASDRPLESLAKAVEICSVS